MALLKAQAITPQDFQGIHGHLFDVGVNNSGSEANGKRISFENCE